MPGAILALLFTLILSYTSAAADREQKFSDLTHQSEIVEAQSSGAVVIDQGDAQLTKGIRFAQDGTVIYKVSQGNGIQYRLNGEEIEFSNPLRWQILGVRRGDVLTMTCDRYFEWMEYYYQDLSGLYIFLLGIVASVLSIFINSVQVASHRRKSRLLTDEIYHRKSVDFILALFALFYTLFGTFFQSIHIYSLSLVISLFCVNLAPLKPIRKLQGFGIVIAVLSLAEFSYILTGSYKIILTMVQWNTIVGLINLLFIFSYLVAFILIRTGKVSRIDNIDIPYIAVVLISTTLTYYAYFFKREYVQFVSVSYSVYFAYKSIISLVQSERNKNKVEQQAIEIEEKNIALHDLNLNLENKVIEKTKDIQSLLDYIPQGILSIDRNCRIMKDYSRVLTSILEEEEVAEASLKTLLISKINNLTDDEKDQFCNAIDSIVGESSLNFMINESKLPATIYYKNKWLACTYSAILHNDTVEKINITLLDVSKQRESEAIAEFQKGKIQIIGELLNVKPQRSVDFFNDSKRFVTSIREAINSSDRTEKAKEIMVALHTIKGAARTYSFRKLTNEIHNAEQYYCEIIDGKEAFNKPRALQEIDSVEQILNLYDDINVNLLGRKSENEKVTVEKDLLKKLYALLLHFSPQASSKKPVPHDIDNLKDSLIRLCFYSAKEVIEESLSGIPSMAKQLNRETPLILVEGDDILIEDDQRSAIMNSFIHIVRNALDHGLETAEERRLKQKAPNGRVSIRIRRISNLQFEIVFSDDGRGLNLAAIRKKGLEKGLIDQAATNESIADLIFQAGLSTASELTDFSGRGTGMDAVRRFFESVGGTVSIKLNSEKKHALGFYDFDIIITLALTDLSAELREAS